MSWFLPKTIQFLSLAKMQTVLSAGTEFGKSFKLQSKRRGFRIILEPNINYFESRQ